MTIEEIHSYTKHNDLLETKEELNYLLQEKIITDIDGFFVYANDLQSVTKRIKGNLEAKKALIIAKQKAKFISKFPFVKAVGISGSLSKGYYDNESDIDFFVITKDSKLWICRTLLMLYKKLFLLNSRKYFCINYFISESQLEIQEKNRFTATELKTLIPLEGKTSFEDFYQNNNWINDYFSNFEPNTDTVNSSDKTYFTAFLEFLMNNKVGNGVDSLFKTLTLKKWNSKFHYLSKEDFNIALKSTNNISKHHPSNFQKKVIMALNEKTEEVQRKFKIELTKEYV